MSGDEPLDATEISAGATLKAAREEIGVSRREVAEALNLPVDTLAAIEDDDAEEMPEPVFARGYVRSYAKLLNLDPEPLVASVSRVATGRAPAARQSPTLTVARNPMLVAFAGLIAVVILLIGLVVWLLVDDDAGDGAEESPSAEVTDVQEAAPTASAPEVVVPAIEPEVAAPVETDVTPEEAGEAAVVEVAEEDVDEAAATPGGYRRITPAGDAQLSIEFTADCWVEVRSVANERLYSRLGTASRPIRLVGEAPFRVQLGYAPGAELRFNGEPIPLVPHTVDNVADLVVGQ